MPKVSRSQLAFAVRKTHESLIKLPVTLILKVLQLLVLCDLDLNSGRLRYRGRRLRWLSGRVGLGRGLSLRWKLYSGLEERSRVLRRLGGGTRRGLWLLLLLLVLLMLMLLK